MSKALTAEKVSYLAFLSKLIALGNTLPVLWPILLRIAADVKLAVDVVRGGPAIGDGGGLEVVAMTDATVDGEPVTAEVLAAEGQVLALACPNPGVEAIGDGTMLRKLFAFAKNNPELMALLLSFLKG